MICQYSLLTRNLSSNNPSLPFPLSRELSNPPPPVVTIIIIFIVIIFITIEASVCVLQLF